MADKGKIIKMCVFSPEKASILGWRNSDDIGKHITSYEVCIFN